MPDPDFFNAVLERLMVLMQAPLNDNHMLWNALPLVIATLFMTLYFGKYKGEQLGWNTAFGNTMVFLFVSLGLIQFMYYSGGGEGDWSNVFADPFYTSATLALAGAAFFMMLITYYHLLPKRLAFFLFSAPPVNVSVYVLMTIIYLQVPADTITFFAAVFLFMMIFLLLKLIQFVEGLAGQEEGVSVQLGPKESPREKFLRKLKEKNEGIKKEKGAEEKA